MLLRRRTREIAGEESLNGTGVQPNSLSSRRLSRRGTGTAVRPLARPSARPPATCPPQSAGRQPRGHDGVRYDLASLDDIGQLTRPTDRPSARYMGYWLCDVLQDDTTHPVLPRPAHLKPTSPWPPFENHAPNRAYYYRVSCWHVFAWYFAVSSDEFTVHFGR